MKDCCLYEDIYKGQFKKNKYRIWSVMGRESVLAYWYVVMYDSTYIQEYCSDNIDLGRVDDKITNQAIDIRKLPNFKTTSTLEILHYRNTIIVPLVKEALNKGYIKPL